jgi:drug/metabolite transporter (DMT)-like permease
VNPHSARLYGSFAIVYLVWGSSFLAVRIGVQDLPPLLFAAGRALIAGLLLLAIASYRGESMPRSRRAWLMTFFFAGTLIVFTNGPVTYALAHLPSNEVALLNASVALWIAWFGTLGPKGQRLRTSSGIGLLIGFLGVGLLVWRGKLQLDEHLGWQMLVIGGGMIWAIGSIVYRNSTLETAPVAFNAAMMLVGALGLFVGGAVTGELPRWHWNPSGMWAMAYLAVFGSAIAYTAYVWLIKNARTDRVATFAYVNPAIATLLGWMVLDERLSSLQVAGMIVVLAGVALVSLPSRVA